MALVKSALFDKIEGSLEDVTFRMRRNNKIELGAKRIPFDPKSAAQLDSRAGYGRLLETWNAVDWIEKTQYDRLAALTEISSWNAWILRHMSAMKASPQHCWPFAEDSGDVLHPILPATNDIVRSGPAWITYGPAELSAWQFNGTTDYGYATDPAPLRLALAESMILGLTVRTTVTNVTKHMIWQLDNVVANDQGYDLYMGVAGTIRFTLSDTTLPGGFPPLRLSSNTKINDGLGHDIKVVVDRDADKGYLYIDDTLEDEKTDNTTVTSENAEPFEIGRNPAPSQHWDGDIRSIYVKIWTP